MDKRWVASFLLIFVSKIYQIFFNFFWSKSNVNFSINEVQNGVRSRPGPGAEKRFTLRLAWLWIGLPPVPLNRPGPETVCHVIPVSYDTGPASQRPQWPIRKFSPISVHEKAICLNRQILIRD